MAGGSPLQGTSNHSPPQRGLANCAILARMRTLLTSVGLGLASCSTPELPDRFWMAPILTPIPISALSSRLALPAQLVDASPENDIDALVNESMSVNIGQLQSHGGVTFGTLATTEAGREYEYVATYARYATVAIPHSVKTLSFLPARCSAVFGALGIGVRVRIRMVARESGINIGSLYAIGAAGQDNRLSGVLTIETIGLSSLGAIQLPVPRQIDVAAVHECLETMKDIKAIMGGRPTKAVPHLYTLETAPLWPLHPADDTLWSLIGPESPPASEQPETPSAGSAAGR